MSLVTCRKTYADIPWAHRQHKHGGHCTLVHGHNWKISITFGCKEPDNNGFVIDFGGLKFIKDWIALNLDHACVFNRDDPMREALFRVGEGSVWKMYVVDSCSCEGMAKHLHELFDPLVREKTTGRAWIVSIEVAEDSKNSAVYSV